MGRLDLKLDERRLALSDDRREWRAAAVVNERAARGVEPVIAREHGRRGSAVPLEPACVREPHGEREHVAAAPFDRRADLAVLDAVRRAESGRRQWSRGAAAGAASAGSMRGPGTAAMAQCFAARSRPSA